MSCCAAGSTQVKNGLKIATVNSATAHLERKVSILLTRPTSAEYACISKDAACLCVHLTDVMSSAPLRHQRFKEPQEHHWGIWLEDKRKLYEFVPDLMPYTYVIQNRRENCRMQVLLDCRSQQRRQWLGEVPKNEADASPWPWFLKETDRNWGTRHSELKGRSCFAMLSNAFRTWCIEVSFAALQTASDCLCFACSLQAWISLSCL